MVLPPRHHFSGKSTHPLLFADPISDRRHAATYRGDTTSLKRQRSAGRFCSSRNAGGAHQAATYHAQGTSNNF